MCIHRDLSAELTMNRVDPSAAVNRFTGLSGLLIADKSEYSTILNSYGFCLSWHCAFCVVPV